MPQAEAQHQWHDVSLLFMWRRQQQRNWKLDGNMHGSPKMHSETEARRASLRDQPTLAEQLMLLGAGPTHTQIQLFEARQEPGSIDLYRVAGYWSCFLDVASTHLKSCEAVLDVVLEAVPHRSGAVQDEHVPLDGLLGVLLQAASGL